MRQDISDGAMPDRQLDLVRYDADMVRVCVEFIVEPFTEGVLGPHVTSALEVLRQAGLEPDVGPFGNTIYGDSKEVFPAFSEAATAAFANNATALSITARVVPAFSDDAEDFLSAMRSVAKAIGARVVSSDEAGPEDTPLVWRGHTVGALHIAARPGDLRQGLGMVVSEVETILGGSLSELSRADKQRAVRLLDDRGAFSIRNAVDDIADAIGVSRVTVYNYLKVSRSAPVSGEPDPNRDR